MRAPRLSGLALALLLPLVARASDRADLDDFFDHWVSGLAGFGSDTLISTYVVDESVEFEGAKRPSLHLHIERTAAGHFRIEVRQAGSGLVVEAYDGRLAWQSLVGGGVGIAFRPDLDPWVLQNDLLFAVRTFLPGIAHVPERSEPIGTRSSLVCRVRDANGNGGRCWIDAETHDLLRIERELGREGGVMRVDYGDFRVVDHLRIPFYARVQDPRAATVHRRTSVVLNGPVDEYAMVMSTADLSEALALGAILRKHDLSIGAPEAIAKLHTRVAHLTLEISTLGTTSAETIYQKVPSQIRIETDTPGMGRETKGFDGVTAWTESELQGYRPLKPAEAAQLASEGTLHVVGHLADNFPFRLRVGDRLVNGRPTVAIALSTLQGRAGTFYFDRENGRLLRVGSTVSGDRENSTEATIDYSDFRKVDGIEIPFVLTQTNPLVRAVSTLLSVQDNPPLADALFKASPADD